MTVSIGAQIGCSANGRAGTLGPLLAKRDSEGVFGLTCSHVLAAGCIGADACSSAVCPCVVQSPFLNFASSYNQIGETMDYCRPLSKTAENDEDFAIFQLSSETIAEPGIALDGTSPVPSGNAAVSLVTAAGILTGTIEDISGSVIKLKLGDLPFDSFKYKGLIKVRYHSEPQPGNSGGLVFLSSTRRAVGIHVGGSANDGYFFPIDAFLAKQGFSLIKS